MNLYINGLGCISPQKTCGDDTFRESAVIPANGVFVCAEPPYREYIDPKVSRRMSRIIKMGIASAKMALADGGMSDPALTGAIITGTGLGCVADTSQFLDDVISTNEGMCSPTAFIQSTHNTISSQIAIHFACHGYNSTYSHRVHSFESALMDAAMRL
ncbi:MAG TPA: beta-ketoacyl synthase chain length factor, partial [Spirochaetota bacterium]|nr:beta-ketoacyl synthase chain length factor [Spirochaetota bacterium]